MESADSNIIRDFSELPEEILSHVISLTTPRDACVSSAVSHAFRSAADSDGTWHRFLPSDYASFLSQAVDEVEHGSKKELYFRLCDHPLLIVGGSMRFGLEKLSGAKIFMISARRLSIAWGDNTRYWEWVALPDSRFTECAKLKWVCSLDLCGKINREILTPNTSYAAYLIFKMRENEHSLTYPFQTAKVTIGGNTVSQARHSVCLNPGKFTDEVTDNVILPRHRRDGWLEVEIGVFHSSDGIDEEVVMSFMERSDYHCKSGLIVQGFEVRPKHY